MAVIMCMNIVLRNTEFSKNCSDYMANIDYDFDSAMKMQIIHEFHV